MTDNKKTDNADGVYQMTGGVIYDLGAFFNALPQTIKVDVQEEKMVFADTGYFLDIDTQYPYFDAIKAHIESQWEMFRDKGWYKRYKPTGDE